MYSFLKNNQKELFDLSEENHPNDRDIILALIDKVEQLAEIITLNLTDKGGNLVKH